MKKSNQRNALSIVGVMSVCFMLSGCSLVTININEGPATVQSTEDEKEPVESVKEPEATTEETRKEPETSVEETPLEKITYKVYVTDTTDGPCEGVTLSFCSGDVCVPVTTDESGTATFEGEMESYEVNVVALPNEYVYKGDKVTITKENAEGTMIIVEKESKAEDDNREKIKFFARKTTNGELIDESVFSKASITMINFWEPWCGPCREEIPDIDRLYNDYKDKGFNVIGVFGDMSYDGASVVSEMGMTYSVVQDADFSNINDTGYVPCTIFVDSKGYMIYPEKIVGSRDYDGWYEMIKDYLN